MIALLAACAPPGPHAGEVVVRLPPEAAGWAHAVGDVWTEHVVDHVDVRLPLALVPPGAAVLIDDLDAAVARSRSGGAGGLLDDWLPLDAIESHLDALDASPRAERVVLGASVEGRPLVGLRIGRDGPDDDVGVLVIGAQHAREWVAASAALAVADRLAWSEEPAVAELLARRRVVVVPVANPDGYEHTWTTDRLWRKNRRAHGDGAFGVDLNRNWAAGFGGVGAPDRTPSDNYPGSAPFSEPETAALRDWLLERPRYGLVLDLHCTGQVALHPFASTGAPAPDAAALAEVTAAMAASASAVHGEDYRAGSFHDALYPASGVAIDWAHEAVGATSALLELRDRGVWGFLLPPDQIEPTADEAFEALIALAAAAPRPALTLQDGGATARIDRLAAGEEVEVWASARGPGETVLPDGTVLGLADAVRVGVGRAGPRGRARVPVPSGAGAWVQARAGAGTTVPARRP